ncbi:serpin family protein [Desulfomonile tiedjei]|nr:serpin family protein [Desulfomonile tiedjei]
MSDSKQSVFSPIANVSRIAFKTDEIKRETMNALEDCKWLAKSVNQFGLKMYPKLIRGDENLIFSPLSIFLSLATAFEGARGQSKDEIGKLLAIGQVAAPLHVMLADLTYQLRHSIPEEHGALSLANGVWIHEFPDHIIHPTFEKVIADFYRATVVTADFRSSPAQVAGQMNDWIKEMTRGKITDLISADRLRREQTVISILNAFYFKNMWLWPFETGRTKDEDFVCSGGSRIKVRMMHSSQRFRYMEEQDLQGLELPYQGWETSMMVFLPRKADGLQEMEKSLTPETLGLWISKFSQLPDVDVSFPKFGFKSRYGLLPTLKEMGMNISFGPGADFSGMLEKKRPESPSISLFITSMLHETRIDLNERGTEAAAATALSISASAPKPERKIFRADHPFMFVIRHNRTGCILLMGRVTNPLAN